VNRLRSRQLVTVSYKISATARRQSEKLQHRHQRSLKARQTNGHWKSTPTGDSFRDRWNLMGGISKMVKLTH